MLLLRCSLPAVSMSRSTSFWPSTMATRSSSAWVALNSMRFIVAFSRALTRKTGPGLPGPGDELIQKSILCCVTDVSERDDFWFLRRAPAAWLDGPPYGGGPSGAAERVEFVRRARVIRLPSLLG